MLALSQVSYYYYIISYYYVTISSAPRILLQCSSDGVDQTNAYQPLKFIHHSSMFNQSLQLQWQHSGNVRHTSTTNFSHFTRYRKQILYIGRYLQYQRTTKDRRSLDSVQRFWWSWNELFDPRPRCRRLETPHWTVGTFSCSWRPNTAPSRQHTTSVQTTKTCSVNKTSVCF